MSTEPASTEPASTEPASTEPASTAQLQQRWQRVMMDNYGTPPIALSRGRGVVVWDADGREYLDLLAGIAVSSLGHAHPAIVDAVSTQVATLAHTSNLAIHEPGVRLAERLADLLGLPARVFLSNDGTTANECALKLTRKHGRRVNPDGSKLEVVASVNGFHGRSLGALSLTGTPAKREPFEPLPGAVRFVDYGDVDALRAAVGPQTAAVFLETTQGEGGIIPAPAGYLAAAREACDRANALLVIDEVQSGIGRTGAWFSCQAEGVRPDVLTLAKGLGGGMPIGACLAVGDAGSLFSPGEHGSTFGGNPVSAAAALAVLDTIAGDHLLDHVKTVGERLADGVTALGSPVVDHVRGSGLWRGVVLTSPVAPKVESAARAHGLLLNAVRPDVVRLVPPLVITADQVDEAVRRLGAALQDVSGG